MNFIKSLRLVLLGVAMAAATLSSVEPASALGGCGANRHRNAWGRCVWGGQNEDWCLRKTGHRATYVGRGIGAASGDVRVGTATSNLAPPLRGAFLCALAHNANVAPLACLRNQPKLLHRLTDLVLVPARETRCWRRTANRRADVTCLPVEEHPRFEISKMQSRHRLVEQLGQRSQRHDHKCRSSNNVERCCSSRTLTCSVQSLNYCIEDTSSRTESNRRT
jgi:hypothetical protein